jgi:Tol biopolymer transport system component
MSRRITSREGGRRVAGAMRIAALLLWAAGCREAHSLPEAASISPEGGRHAGLSYSPDGSKVSWWTQGGDSTVGYQLWVANADMSDPRRLPATNLPGCNPSGGCPAVWSPDGRRLAVQTSEFRLASVGIVDLDGGPARQVTTGGGYELPVMWHPDGERVLVLATTEGGSVAAFSVSAATGAAVRLVPDEPRPHFGYWSPDGTLLGYIVVEGPLTTIWVTDSSGAGRRQLTTEGLEYFCCRTPWSPDGRFLLYESRRTGNNDLWIVGVDGSPPRQLTRDVRHDQHGTWSDDGQWIAFVSHRGRQTDIWAVSPIDGREIRITDTAEEEAMPTWRPGTTELSFLVQSPQSALWALAADGGAERQITDDSLRAGQFSVSPDGARAAVVLERGGGSADLAIVPVAGGPVTTLVSSSANIQRPVWSPDGAHIAFTSDRSGTDDVWIVPASGGEARALVGGPSWDMALAYSADGKGVYFGSDRDAVFYELWYVPLEGGEPRRVTTTRNIVGAQRFGDILVAFRLSERSGHLEAGVVTADGEYTDLGTSDVCCAFGSRTGSEVGITAAAPGGVGRTLVITKDGKSRREILGPQDRIGPWSPDDRYVLFVRPGAGGMDVGIHELVTGAERMITSSPADEQNPEWAEGGRTVIVRRTNNAQRIHLVRLKDYLGKEK